MSTAIRRLACLAALAVIIGGACSDDGDAPPVSEATTTTSTADAPIAGPDAAAIGLGLDRLAAELVDRETDTLGLGTDPSGCRLVSAAELDDLRAALDLALDPGGSEGTTVVVSSTLVATCTFGQGELTVAASVLAAQTLDEAVIELAGRGPDLAVDPSVTADGLPDEQVLTRTSQGGGLRSAGWFSRGVFVEVQTSDDTDLTVDDLLEVLPGVVASVEATLAP